MSERSNTIAFCSKCGAALPPESNYCLKCGSPVPSDLPSQDPKEQGENKPWYFSKPILVSTFLLLTPVWALLILADRRQGRAAKAFAGVVTVGYVSLFGYIFLADAPLVSTLVGPAEIEFGSDYLESAQGDISITDPRSSFSYDDEFAWVAHLDAPAGTTRVDLVLSKVTQSGGEQVIERTPMDLANPRYMVLFGKSPYFLSFIEPGLYRLRVMSRDNTLAVGEFELINQQ